MVDSSWAVVMGAAIGAGGALGTAALTSFVQMRAARVDRWREERIEVHRDFITKMLAYESAKSDAERRAAYEAVLRATYEVHLICSYRAARAAGAWRESMKQKVESKDSRSREAAKHARYIRAMKRDLGTRR